MLITKAEWQEWKMNKVTQKLTELIKLGHYTAVQQLIGARGEIGDYHRGVGTGFEEILEYINTGEEIYQEVENA